VDPVVSGFGLEAEGALGVRVGGPAGGLVLALVRQSDLVAALLLHALGQAADGDLAAQTEPVRDQQKSLDPAMWRYYGYFVLFNNTYSPRWANMKTRSRAARLKFYNSFF